MNIKHTRKIITIQFYNYMATNGLLRLIVCNVIVANKQKQPSISLIILVNGAVAAAVNNRRERETDNESYDPQKLLYRSGAVRGSERGQQ